jgi:drug/metabolite transporter (DMT)-like permease
LKSPILKAFFVTFLWSTSWILIKLSIDSIPPLLFAGMRYFIAFVVLYLMTRKHKPFKTVSKEGLFWIVLYGVVMITLTQGAQFVALSILPTIIVSLSLNATPIVVAVFGYFILKEKLLGLQWLGMFLYVIGVLLYFYPFATINQMFIGIIVALCAILFNSSATIIGRYVNQQKFLPSIQLTMISMLVGSVLLLIIGLSFEPFPKLVVNDIIILMWLGIVNTALAFTLWNQALEQLTAVSASLINSTMMIQIALLAWIFLGESLSNRQWLAISFVFLGVVMVQVLREKVRVKN